MFDEISGFVKEKDRAKRKGYLRINTNLGTLNYELHCDKVRFPPFPFRQEDMSSDTLQTQAPKTCYNFMMLAKEGKYDE
jgi:peptidyl-prolyl cis-trans isomerase-like 2